MVSPPLASPRPQTEGGKRGGGKHAKSQKVKSDPYFDKQAARFANIPGSYTLRVTPWKTPTYIYESVRDDVLITWSEALLVVYEITRMSLIIKCQSIKSDHSHYPFHLAGP